MGSLNRKAPGFLRSRKGDSHIRALLIKYLNDMTVTKENKGMSLTVTEGLTVSILPNPTHQFLMTSKEAAIGYGCTEYAIRHIKSSHSSELIEGKHFLTAVRISHSEPNNKVYWTKRGVVRLGFFIKSKNAKLFRDWAEDLIIDKLLQPTLFEVDALPDGKVRHYKGNRLTLERENAILKEVMLIDDGELRKRITNLISRGGK